MAFSQSPCFFLSCGWTHPSLPVPPYAEPLPSRYCWKWHHKYETSCCRYGTL